MSTAYTTSLSDGGIDEAGIAVLQFCMIVAVIVVTIGLAIMFCLKKSGQRALRRRGEGADNDEEISDDDFDDEAST
jgi:predicted lipid-binding transport protein (Tim44 family)